MIGKFQYPRPFCRPKNIIYNLNNKYHFRRYIYIYYITLVMDIDYWLFLMFFHRHIYRDINALSLILGYITQGMNYCGYI